MLRLLLLCSCIVFIGTSPLHKEHFTLHVGHVNDFHARFDETNNYGGSCKSKKCIGGFSRLYSELIKLKKNDPNVILLNAGDNFQGTFYYSFYKWNITQHFMNKIPFDAYTLGNHEFDDEIKGVVPFIQSLKAPTVVSNIDDSLEPTFQHIYTKSVVIERNGKKIGIIGVTTDTLPSIAKSGKLKLQDESESVNKEAKRLVEVEKVFTIIVLSHCGFDHDQRIAKNAPEKVSLIVGGHTHTFLYSGATKLGPDEVQGPYPTVVKRKDGKSVLITQASAFCKYYGNITVSYDKFGEMVKWDGAPVFLDTTVPQSQEINKELDAWRAGLVAIGQKVLGSTTKLMNNEECYYKECTLGNVITDAYIHYYSNKNTSYPLIAAVNAGGIRSTIPAGNITYEDIITIRPFGDDIYISEIQGNFIKEMLEATTIIYDFSVGKSSIRLLQVSGLKYVINMLNSEGSRVISVKVLCNNCSIPKYEDLDYNKTYRIILSSFLVFGGDNYIKMRTHLKNSIVGDNEIDVLTKYLMDKSPLSPKEEGRVNVIGLEEAIKTRKEKHKII